MQILKRRRKSRPGNIRELGRLSKMRLRKVKLMTIKEIEKAMQMRILMISRN